MNNIKKLLDKITVESVTNQIADGWDSSQAIAKFIVGTKVWDSLPEWDRKILTSRTHNVVVKNKLLENK